MSGLEGSRIKKFAEEMTDEAGGREVWAFVATYDRHGFLNWKAFGFDADGVDIVLGSELVNFGSVND